ncbi:MAG: DNA internalization-related competence protein ComEC/Rec2 [Gammaproteobacteria bacterium]|nr:DNA internalization-related competence protein ComEC/Rec2 [Gammaproteobacteria bacterium]
MALLYWLSPLAAMIALVLEIVALFYLITKPKQWWLVILVYSLSSLWALSHFLAAMNQQIPLLWQNKVVRLNATIVSMVSRDKVKQHFRVQARQICFGKECVKLQAKIDLNVYMTPQDKRHFEPGQSWIFYARLKRLHRLANPSLLQPLEWAQGLYAVGSVLNHPAAELLPSSSELNINRLRQALATRLSLSGLNDSTLAVVLALTLGDRSRLSPDLWRLFQQTGVLHLMAISGLHVGLVATFVYVLMYLLLWPFPTLFHFIPRQKIAMWVAVLMAWIYGALAGFAVSTVRACIMMSLYVLAKSVSRSLSWSSVLLWSSVMILVISPLQSLNISFWLSFIAVSWIAFLVWVWPKQQGFLRRHLLLPLVLSLCLLPVSLLFFQKSPLNAPLTNLLAIPWVSFVILPSALLTLIVPSLFGLVQWNMTYFLRFLQKMVEFLPYQWWHGSSLLSLGLMMGGIALLLFPRFWQLSGIAVLWLLLAWGMRFSTHDNMALRVTILDVGQGLSVVLQTSQHTLLYDTGPAYYGGGDAAQNAIVPFLKQQEIASLNAMVVSHQDSDHSGGVATVLKQLPVDTLMSSTSRSPFLKKIYAHPQEKLQLSQCQAGQAWRWDGVEFRFLSPLADAVDKKGNNLSCVLMVAVAGHRVLLTGDIEDRVERTLLQSQAKYLAAEVLIAPHHGSDTSSSAAFIKAVQPKIVVFSTGYLNRYHFPSKNVQKRYQREGVLAYNTADDGAVTFAINAQGRMSPVTIVRTKPAFWQDFLKKIDDQLGLA